MSLVDTCNRWEERLSEVEREIAAIDGTETKVWRLHLGDNLSELRREIREVRLRLLREEIRQ